MFNLGTSVFFSKTGLLEAFFHEIVCIYYFLIIFCFYSIRPVDLRGHAGKEGLTDLSSSPHI